MGYQTAPHGSLGLPYGLYQFMSLSEGTALIVHSFVTLEAKLYVNDVIIESALDIIHGNQFSPSCTFRYTYLLSPSSNTFFQNFCQVNLVVLASLPVSIVVL